MAKEYVRKGLYIPNSPGSICIIRKHSKRIWEALNKKPLRLWKVDSWRMDATEPENDALTESILILTQVSFIGSLILFVRQQGHE